MMRPVPVQGCGYCRDCVKLRVLSAVGRQPERHMECAYKHILDSYSACLPAQADATSGQPASSAPPSPGGSCGSNCRWTSSGSSSRPSYDDMSFSDEYEPTPYMYRKRIKFIKRKKV